MRVIAGSKRRTNLETIPGLSTRPTTDQIKETLFNMIAPDLNDIHFLDLFAGSGQMGIEALSRGAAHAWFVEKNPAAVKCIRANLNKCDLAGQSDVIMTDYKVALTSHKMPEHVDIVFMDPPYDHLLEKDALDILKDRSYVDPDTMIIIEASLKTSFDYLDDMGYVLIKEKLYKTNKHVFVSIKAGETNEESNLSGKL